MLKEVKSYPVLRVIPVVILTSSREESDLVAGYNHGANAFVVKPVKFDEFVEVFSTLGAFWAVLNEAPAILLLGLVPGSADREP